MKLNTFEPYEELMDTRVTAGQTSQGVEWEEGEKNIRCHIRPSNKLGHVDITLDKWIDPDNTVLVNLRNNKGEHLFPSTAEESEGEGVNYQIFGIYPRVDPLGDMHWLCVAQPVGS